MRALLGAFGTRGDVQPIVALALELLRRGHTVSLAVSPSSLDFVRRHGLAAFPVGIDFEEISRRAAIGSLRQIYALMPLVRDQVDLQLAALEGPAAEADVIIGSSVFMIGAILGEALEKPWGFVALFPQFFRSAEHPSPSTTWHGLPRWVNRLTWSFNTFAWERLLKKKLDEVRATRRLAPVRGVWDSVVGDVPIAAYDPALAGTPSDHRVAIHQVGSLQLDEAQELSPEVEAFLRAGPPPVYIGFGSMSDPAPERTARRLMEAARRAKTRAIISRGWAGLEAPKADDILVAGPEPHGKLLPRCAAVVHHGGAGTTHAAARAGRPQVVMPQIFDQHFWGRQVRKLGISPGTVPRHEADPAPLAQAIARCLADGAMQERAKALASKMSLDGAARAVTLCERLAARR